MKSSDVDILIVPGWNGSGPDHWQSRWEAKLSSARRVEQDDWDRPELGAWTARLVGTVEAAARPVVLVAHSLGVPTVVHAAPRFTPGKVAGAYLVAAPDIEHPESDPLFASFTPVPRERLPFPAVLVASRADPFCGYARAEALAEAWGAELVDAGESGHINTASGHGPWPEGSMRFAGFLKSLG